MQVLFWFVVLSLLLAATALGIIAWRTARGVRERDLARAELLRALSFPGGPAEPESGPSISDWTAEFLTRETAPAVDTREAAAPIFAEHAESATALPRWVSLAGVAAAMALGVTLYAVVAGRPEAASATTRPANATAAPAASAPANAGTTAIPDRPIELIALRHRSEPKATFDVSGRVRNPSDGHAQGQVVAVVNLMDADGRILTSQTTPLEQPVLEAGETSAFSVVFPRVTGTVARYQVRFRARGGDTIPHVDRRNAEAGAKAPVS